MERDGLPFAVVVGRQDDVAGQLHDLLQLADVAGRVLGHHVVGHEVVLDVDAQPAEPLAQVPDVAIGGSDGVVAAQVLLDRLRLGGRFDDHERLVGHGRGTFTGRGASVEPGPFAGTVPPARLRFDQAHGSIPPLGGH